MHIAVVTTSVADRKQTERLLGRANLALSEELGTLYMDSFGDDASFLHACMKYDMFLIDFEDMQHSYKIYDELIAKNAPGIIVFCINHPDITIEEKYQNEQVMTINKPLLTKDLHELIRNIHLRIEEKKASHCLIELRCEAGTRYVEKDDILYAKYHEREHKVQYFFQSGESIIYFGPIDDIYRSLGMYKEFEIRFKLYIVNTDHVVSETKKTVTMSDGDVLNKPLFTNPLTNIW